MGPIKRLFVAATLSILVAAGAWAAGDPLFVNLTAEPKAHRTEMALTFASNVVKRGHPVTVFLNDEAVKAAAKSNADAGKARGMLSDLLKAGATVIACPLCMKHYGIAESDLLDGVKVGSPELTQGALFAPSTRTLTW